MRSRLIEFVTERRVVTRAQALAVAPRHVIDDAVTSGALAVMHPGVYALPDSTGDRWTRRAAAVAYTSGVVSHLDALDLWGLLPPSPHYVYATRGPVHVCVPQPAGARRRAGLVVHRSARLDLSGPTYLRQGLQTVGVERAMVQSWPLLPVTEARSPIITALRERRTTSQRLLEECARTPHAKGMRELRSVVTLVASGCHSELEIRGHAQVLSDARLPPSRAQVPMVLPRGVVYLDRYFDAEMVAVEFDGAAYHGSSRQRERDVQRDSALAALGIVTVRVTHQRLVTDPDGVVDELLAVLQTRRAQLTGARAAG